MKLRPWRLLTVFLAASIACSSTEPRKYAQDEVVHLIGIAYACGKIDGFVSVARELGKDAIADKAAALRSEAQCDLIDQIIPQLVRKTER